MENSGVVHMLKNNKTDGKLLLEYFKNCFLSCRLLIAKHNFDSLSFEVELPMNVNLFILKRKKGSTEYLADHVFSCLLQISIKRHWIFLNIKS